MKNVIAIIFLIPALVLIGTGEVSTQGILTLENLISIESKAVDVPVELVYAVILTESSGNPLAKSEADCRGLMQVSEEVWNIFMKGKSWNLAYNPEENLRCGTNIWAIYTRCMCRGRRYCDTIIVAIQIQKER